MAAERKVSAQMELEKYKADAKISIEHAQANADIAVKEAELKKNMEFQMFKAEQDRAIAVMRNELDLIEAPRKCSAGTGKKLG